MANMEKKKKNKWLLKLITETDSHVRCVRLRVSREQIKLLLVPCDVIYIRSF